MAMLIMKRKIFLGIGIAMLLSVAGFIVYAYYIIHRTFCFLSIPNIYKKEDVDHETKNIFRHKHCNAFIGGGIYRLCLE